MEFGIIEEKIKNGLFGCSLNWITRILPFLKKNNIFPEWEIDTFCYGPLFPSILKTKYSNTIFKNKVKLTDLKENWYYPKKEEEAELIHNLFFEFFDISDDILEKVNKNTSQFGLKTLGVHYRGTDKFKSEASYVSGKDVIKNINEFLKIENTFDTIFVCSDEELFIKIFKSNFENKSYTIIFSDSVRTNDSIPIHIKNNTLGKEAMTDSITLSRCDYVIKTSSALSDWVKIWNPKIEVYNLNKCYNEWFPQSIIPVKTYI